MIIPVFNVCTKRQDESDQNVLNVQTIGDVAECVAGPVKVTNAV